MSDAYSLGVEAFERGDEFGMNPYDVLDVQSEDWQHGWMDAYAESK